MRRFIMIIPPQLKILVTECILLILIVSCIIKMKINLRCIKYDKMDRCIDRDRLINSIKGYLRQCLFSTNVFFKLFKSIISVETDKGKGMVILKRETYHNKMEQHINNGLEMGVYTNITMDKKILDDQIYTYNNTYLIYKKWTMNLHKNNCDNIPEKLLNYKRTNKMVFYAAHIYGTLKVHKEDIPIRPIVADFNNPLRYIQDLLKLVLNRYIDKERFSFIINNTSSIIDYSIFN